MRVPVLGRLRREESGAVAVIVALMSIVLIGVSAFTIDFGMAYVNKRQLQIASDAASLAAAAAYGNASGTCATKTADTSLRATAETAADYVRDRNRPGATGSITSVSCTPDNKGVQVQYSSTASTASVVGGIFGHTTGYSPAQSATAVVGIPKGAIGVRPYAVCAAQLPTTYPSAVVKLTLPGAGNTQCPGASTSGNWWEIDCPEASSNSNSYLGTATQYGCTTEIDVVPGQGTMSGAPLRTYLDNYCPARSLSCLSANTGNLGGTPILQAWNSLVSSQAKVVLPVFCGGYTTPAVGQCDTAAVVNAGGNNAIYPVQSLVGVEICGYHFGGQDSSSIPMTGDCTSSTYAPNQGTNQDNYLLVRAIKYQSSGTSSDFADCSMGAACDTGNFAVHLIQ
ncbi:MAG: TadE/TadG family type IV pilus assembly protein [Mycobacteriaceae bacterium]